MVEQDQPRVNPSDWASRRKHAMSRARELRSRIKEAEHHQGSSDASLTSRSEIQRQRRSRQLEATQKLLDDQAGGFNLTASSSGRSMGSKSEGSRQKVNSDDIHEKGIARVGCRASTQRHNREDQSVGESGFNGETHSIISQRHVRRIHERYTKPVENDSLPLASEPQLDHDARSTRYRYEEEDHNRPMQGSNKVGGMKFEPPSSDATPNHTISKSLREKPLEGRGRGRGRRRSPSGSSSLREPSLTSKTSLHTHSSAIVEDQMVHSKSRQPSSTHPYRRGQSDTSEVLSQSYLRGRQVPAYKEGECEKLATLRQRLVARRQTRYGKENAKPESTRSVRKSNTSRYDDRHDGANGTSEGISQSLERLDPNDYSASDFQRKPKNMNNDAMTSPSRLRIRKLEDRHSDYQEASMDKSSLSYSQSKRGEGGINDEASVEEGDINDEASVVDIKLMKCDYCKRSFAPKVYAKHFDSNGQPKCAGALDKKREVFNSAKARIANNSNLNSDEQRQVLQANKKTTKELSRNLQGKRKKKSKRGSKWKEESATFREAMRANRLISKAEREGKPAHYYL